MNQPAFGEPPISSDHHPSEEAWSDYAVANMSPGAALVLAAHAQLCAECSLALHRAVEGDGAIASWAPGAQVKPQAILDGLDTGEWRRISRDVEAAKIHRVSGLGESVRLVRAAPGAALSSAFGTDVEWILVLEGGLRIADTELKSGDLRSKSNGEREAVADPETGCLCLVVSNEILSESLLGSLLSRVRDWLFPTRAAFVRHAEPKTLPASNASV